MTAPRSLALAAPEGPAATGPAEPVPALPRPSVRGASGGAGDEQPGLDFFTVQFVFTQSFPGELHA